MAWHQQRRSWGIVGMSLVIAALIVLVAASVYVSGLPSRPIRCEGIDCSDPIYDLRTPYAWITVGAVLAGIAGFVVLARARPIRWTGDIVPPRGWLRVRSGILLLLGLLAGVHIPWWVFMMGLISWNVPMVTLIVALSAATVHFTLLWWLRRQSGMDRGAWAAALTVQVLVTMVTLAIAITLMFFVPRLILLGQVVCLAIGAGFASRTLKSNDNASSSDEDVETASKRQPLGTFVAVGVIALATLWASLPQPVPDDLQARLDNGDWRITTSDRESSRIPGPRTYSPAPPQESRPTERSDGPGEAAPPCGAEALAVSVDGWDAATGARAATLVVTNQQGEEACQLRGTPEFRVIQAGEDLSLTVGDLDASQEVNESVHPDITIESGQSAQAMLYWRGERSAYHDDSAQQAQINIDGEWIDARFDYDQLNQGSDSPIDLVQDGEIEIGQWSRR